MLVKLAFVMQRLKKYLKTFLSRSTKMGGDTAVMRGDIELMGGIPPLGKTLGSYVTYLNPAYMAIGINHMLSSCHRPKSLLSRKHLESYRVVAATF